MCVCDVCVSQNLGVHVLSQVSHESSNGSMLFHIDFQSQVLLFDSQSFTVVTLGKGGEGTAKVNTC